MILGSAFGAVPDGYTPLDVPTRFGTARLWKGPRGYLVFRHGVPHRWLPNQIPYRAQAAALAEVGVGALLVTSSVGVLDPTLPLLTPMLVDDLVWFDNRLPDGTAATMWPEPHPDQAHLVLQAGLFSKPLENSIRALAQDAEVAVHPDPVVFWYAPGPRTKTAAENRAIAQLGAQVNSMTLAPEVVLANELGIPCAAVVVGHKPSGPGMDREAVARSLEDARAAVQTLVHAFLATAEPVAFENHLYRY